MKTPREREKLAQEYIDKNLPAESWGVNARNIAKKAYIAGFKERQNGLD